jgi:hypothetical protein
VQIAGEQLLTRWVDHLRLVAAFLPLIIPSVLDEVVGVLPFLLQLHKTHQKVEIWTESFAS